MDIVDNFIASALVPVAATYAEDIMEDSQGDWLEQGLPTSLLSYGSRALFFLSSATDVVRTIGYAAGAATLLDRNFGTLQSGLGRNALGRSNPIAWAISTIGIICIFCGAGISYVFPQTERYFSTAEIDRLPPPSPEDFEKHQACYDGASPINMTCKVTKPVTTQAKVLFLRAAREAAILLLFPSYRVVHCISFICLAALCLRKLQQEDAPLGLKLKFSWHTPPKSRWQSSITSGDAQWDLYFKVNKQNQYLCPSGHKVADNPQDLMHLVEQKRKTLLDNSNIDLHRVIHRNQYGLHVKTTYIADLKLEKDARVICPQCNKEEGNLKIKIFWPGWLMPNSLIAHESSDRPMENMIERLVKKIIYLTSTPISKWQW